MSDFNFEIYEGLPYTNYVPVAQVPLTEIPTYFTNNSGIGNYIIKKSRELKLETKELEEEKYLPWNGKKIDVNRAINVLQKNTENPQKHMCTRYVVKALEDSTDVKTPSGISGPKELAAKLKSEGWKNVLNSNYTPKKGDIFTTWDTTKGGKYNKHSSMYDGKQWISYKKEGDTPYYWNNGKASVWRALYGGYFTEYKPLKGPKWTLTKKIGEDSGLDYTDKGLEAREYQNWWLSVFTKDPLKHYKYPFTSQYPELLEWEPEYSIPEYPVTRAEHIKNYVEKFTSPTFDNDRNALGIDSKVAYLSAPVGLSEKTFQLLLLIEGGLNAPAKKIGKEDYVTGPYGMLYKFDANGKVLGRFKAGETMSDKDAQTNARRYYKLKSDRWLKLLNGKPVTQNQLDALVATNNGTWESQRDFEEYVVSHWNNPKAVEDRIRNHAVTVKGERLQGLVTRRQYEADLFSGDLKFGGNWRGYLKAAEQNLL